MAAALIGSVPIFGAIDAAPLSHGATPDPGQNDWDMIVSGGPLVPMSRSDGSPRRPTPAFQVQESHSSPPKDWTLASIDGYDAYLKLLTRVPAVPDLAAVETPKDLKISEELRCLAMNIYFEARSEPETGRRAVGHVVMNRVAHPRFPDSVCEVVHQGGEKRRHRCQFSWWCDGRTDEPKNRAAWRSSLRIATEIMLGYSKDPTGGALWYHADYVKPSWHKAFVQSAKIGRHVFYLKPGHADKARSVL